MFVKLAGVALALGLAGTVAVVTLDDESGPRARATVHRVPPAYMIGDSITAQSVEQLRQRRPTWEIDGVGGRPALSMLPLLRQHRTRYEEVADLVVIALGSNEDGAARWRYQRAVDLLPADTTVMFVTTYRDADDYGAWRARKAAQVSGWMQELARQRPHTCTAPWRRTVLRHPELLRDGVHPSEQGKQVWARVVDHTARDCAVS